MADQGAQPLALSVVTSDHAPVSSKRITWHEKVRRLIGWPKKGVNVRLARAIKEPSRTVYGWLRWDRSPQDESAVLAKIAAHLQVPTWWLTNGKDDERPLVGPAATPALFDAIAASNAPEHVKQVALALTDDGAARFLAEQLRVYRETVAPRRRGT